MRLDPLSLPVSFDAHDFRADGGVRRVELHREHVVLRRAVRGMQMAINIRVRDFLGVALRGFDDAQMLLLVHRDPSLTIPLDSDSRCTIEPDGTMICTLPSGATWTTTPLPGVRDS